MESNNSNVNSKNILVVDWSNLMFRSLFMHKLFSGVSSGSYDRPEDLLSFTNKFAVDVCAIVNMFRPNRVIIATDSQHAWRKDVDPNYKSGREKDPSVNWDNIYKCSDDLLAILAKNGMDVAQVDRAEADDIVALVKETVFKKHPDFNIIVVSADADIRQLIDFNKETKQYCVVYNTTGRGKNSKRRMYVTQDFKDWIDSPDNCDIFFGNIDIPKSHINEILKKNSIIEVFVDDPNQVVLNKILCGDDGDNVPSFYGFYKNGRWVRITPTKAEKILQLSNSQNVKQLCESVNMFPSIFEKVCKKVIDDLDFEATLYKQRVLVELNSELFPEHIREYADTIDYMIRNGHNGIFADLNAQELLAGSEYEGANQKKALEADVFKDINKMIKKRAELRGDTLVDEVTPQKVTTAPVATTPVHKPKNKVENDVLFEINTLF